MIQEINKLPLMILPIWKFLYEISWMNSDKKKQKSNSRRRIKNDLRCSSVKDLLNSLVHMKKSNGIVFLRKQNFLNLKLHLPTMMLISKNYLFCLIHSWMIYEKRDHKKYIRKHMHLQFQIKKF